MKTGDISSPLAGCAPKVTVAFLLEKFPVGDEEVQWISYSNLCKKITIVSVVLADSAGLERFSEDLPQFLPSQCWR
jgi:hypothetical protein